MKRFFAKRWHNIPVGIVAVALLFYLVAGSAFAYNFTKTVPNTVAVTANTSIEAYSDPGITPLTAIAWGNMKRGTSSTQEVYIKYVGDNTGGTADIILTVESAGLPSGVTLTWSAFGSERTELGLDGSDVGGITELTLSLNVTPSAPVGSTSFSIKFNTNPK